MSYVPPALRRKQEALAKGEKLSDDASTPETSDPGPMSTLPTVTHIQNHFWPPKKGVSQTNPQASANGEKDASQSLQKDISQSIEGGANLEDRASKTNSEDGASGGIKSTLPHSHSTLNGTQAEPDKLKYVLLFHQAVSLVCSSCSTQRSGQLAWTESTQTLPACTLTLYSTHDGRQTRSSTSNQNSNFYLSLNHQQSRLQTIMSTTLLPVLSTAPPSPLKS